MRLLVSATLHWSHTGCSHAFAVRSCDPEQCFPRHQVQRTYSSCHFCALARHPQTLPLHTAWLVCSAAFVAPFARTLPSMRCSAWPHHAPRKKQNAFPDREGVLRDKAPGGDLLLHGSPHYHRRSCVSLPSSGWDRVGPQRYSRQGRGGSSALKRRLRRGVNE